jgi:hypothetical protein
MILLGPSAWGQAAGLRAAIQPDRTIVLDGTDTVAVYQTALRSRPDGRFARANYFHPVYAPDGSLLTEDFPADHYHHRGIFWAWHQVYAGEDRAGDAWECRHFSWRVDQVSTTRKGRSLDLHATVTWESRLPGRGEAPVALAEESLTVRFHPVRNGRRRVDFRIHIRPLVAQLSLGGSEDAKGYGGFSWRLPLPEDVAFYGTGGPLTPRETGIPDGRRLRIRGTFSGGYRQLEIRQRSQPGGVWPWILRRSGSMQNVAFPGREPYVLPPEGIELGYTLLL